MIINLNSAEYEQLVVDLEEAKAEIEEMSRTVDYFCSMVPERLEGWLLWLRQIKDANDNA